MANKAQIKRELAKVRRDPDYVPSICLRCGREFGKSTVVLFGIEFEEFKLYAYDDDGLLCEDCMDLEIIEQAKELGEWEEEMEEVAESW